MTGYLDIVIPYAGSASLLRLTVMSVVGQDDPEWHLTVIEDGDQDTSVAPWLASLRDERITYLKNSQTLGVAGNFQRCLDASTEEFVVVLGCDDLLAPDYVSTIRQALMDHPEVDVVQPGVEVINAAGEIARPLGDVIKRSIGPRSRSGVLVGEPLLRSLMIGNWTYFPSLCWRRAAIADPGFDQQLTTVLDLELLSRIVLDGAALLLVPEVVFRYRRHPASVSSLTAISTDRFIEEQRVMALIASQARSRGWRGAARAARLRTSSRLHAALLAPRAVRNGDMRAFRTLMRHICSWK